MKKVTALFCAIALVVTGFGFAPQSTKAADAGWFDAIFDTPAGVPWYHYHTDKTTAGDQEGIWDYTGPGGAEAQYTNGDKVESFAWKVSKLNSEAEWLETDNLMDIPCVKQGDTWVKPTPGMNYKLNMTIDYTNNTNGDTQLQIWNVNGYDGEVEHKDVEDNVIFNPRKSITSWSCENVDIFLMPGNEFKIHLGVAVQESYKYYDPDTHKTAKFTNGATFTISDFSLVPDSEYDVVPANDDTFKPSVNNPWTLSAHYVPSTATPPADNGSYGVMLYNVAGDETDIANTTMKLASTVGEPEKDEQGQRITDPAKRWWWISASLLGYAEQAGLEDKYDVSSGTITVNTSKATGEDCYLYVYVDGTEYQFALDEGLNELEIPEFIYAGGQDIKFLFDEMPKGAVVNIEDIQFTQEPDDWETVPNAEPTFTEGPWNMFGNFVDEPGSGIYGVLQYKANTVNPESYKDYDFRVASNSGWEDAWSVFARLEDYCSDYFDVGDEYNVTIKLNSSKATVPKPDPSALDQLLVIVGADKYYFDLQAGENTLNIHGNNYNLNQSEPHEQILLQMDGLEKGTVLTVTDIQTSGPNDGWINVPNKKDTTVGAWTLFGWWDATHWSKLAYKNRAGATGLGATDIKVRRNSDSLNAMAALAMLPNYLATAKDTKDRPIANADEYQIKVTMNASGLDSSVNNYGTVRLLANDQAFDFNIQKGTKTYDLLELCGKKMTYDSLKTGDVEFELDKVSPKAVLNIQKIEFVGPDDQSQDVPNGVTIQPEGTPWFLYAITAPEDDRYGAMRYEVIGDPADLSSLKITLKSVSGWLDARSVRATLNSYLDSLTVGKTYKITVKMAIDESGVAPADKNPSYDKKLRMTLDNKNYDFNVANPAVGTQTFEQLFTYTGASKHLAFDFDQLLKGSKVRFSSIEIVDPTAPTTTQTPTTQSPTQPTTQAPTGDTTQAPTEVTTSAQQPTDVTTKQAETATVKAPGKAKIKKVYKKKRSAKKLKVKLKKVKGAKGYQVAVYKSKKTAKKNKKALAKKYTKKLKVTLKSKKLKKKKKLYVRARAYVLNASGIKVFGKWSAIKKGKTKK